MNKRGKFIGGGASSVHDGLELWLSGGGMVFVPYRYEKRGDTNYRWSDFSALSGDDGGPLACERCGGHLDDGHESGFPGSAEGGFLPIMLIAIDADEQRREISCLAACSCAFGAWRHQVQHFDFADKLPIPRGLDAEEWGLLRMYHRPGMTHKEAAASVREGLRTKALTELAEADEQRMPRMRSRIMQAKPTERTKEPEFVSAGSVAQSMFQEGR